MVPKKAELGPIWSNARNGADLDGQQLRAITANPES